MIPFNTQIIPVMGLDEALGRRGRNVRCLFICCASSSCCCLGYTACLRFAIRRVTPSVIAHPPDSSLHSLNTYSSLLRQARALLALCLQQRGQTLLSTGHSLARSRTATTGIWSDNISVVALRRIPADKTLFFRFGDTKI